ncbi:MAG TPA: hypothetical protein VF796_27560, partial [Humisphaera sp.]
DPEPGDPNVNALTQRLQSEYSQYDPAVRRPPQRGRTPAVTPEQPVPGYGMPEYDPTRDRRPSYGTPSAEADGSLPRRGVWPSPQGGIKPAPSGGRPAPAGGREAIVPPVPPPTPPPAPVTQPAKPPATTTPPVPPEYGQGKPLDTPARVGAVTTVVDVLGQRLRDRAKQSPQDLQAQFDLQLYNVLTDGVAPDPAALLALPRDQREMIATIIDALVNWRNLARRDGNLLPSEQVRPLLELADRLRAQSELTIPTVALCSRVVGYGVYDPLPTTFRAGQDVPVIVYSEVANFSSRLNDKQLWETRLNMGVALYTETGVNVLNNRSDVPPDLSRNRRHDFFVVKRLVLPRTMAVGRYILKVTITDTLGNRVSENSVEITMTAQ